MTLAARLRTVLGHMSGGGVAPLRIAVVGAGSVGREFALQHFGPQTGTVVSCVVDIDAGRRRALAADVGSVQAGAPVVGRGYRSTPGRSAGEPVPHRAELDAEALAGCDAVYIGTTPASHASLVERALGAGRHVLLEKPLAASAADADRVVALAEAALRTQGVHTSVDIGMRWNAALHAMRKELAAGRLGPLRAGRLRLHFGQWPREWQVQEWCGGRAEGGPLREVGTHFVFAVLELFGQQSIRRVQAVVEYPDGPNGMRSETSVQGALEVADARLGAEPLRLELSVRTDDEACRASGADLYELEVEGSGGKLRLYDFTSLADGDGTVLVRSAPYGRRECVAGLVASAAGPPGAAEELVSARQARSAQRVLEAVLHSGGSWCDVSYD